MKTTQLYPLKFRPQLLEKVWGGSQLCDYLEKDGEGLLGESWELSGVKGHISEVINGDLAGTTLIELISQFGADLLGKKVAQRFGSDFPLLFKFIDANQDLSVQLHPDDEMAKKRHNSFGKTEMWYVIKAGPKARLIVGFSDEIDKDTYKEHLENGTITSILKEELVTAGDSFFIAPGTVHAIGAGVLLAEIQQTSNITYRIYDWDRPGIDGNFRELHNDLALDIIEFSDTKPKLDYKKDENAVNHLCTSNYFHTNVLKYTTKMARALGEFDSFVAYMCVEGTATITGGTISEEIKMGETILIPAAIKEIEIDTANATLLEVYVP